MLELTRPIVDIAIVCSDFEKSLHFYRDCLGLEVAADLQIPEEVATGAGLAPRPFRHVRLKAGDTLIKLMDIDSPPATRSSDFAAGVRWLTFFVENVEETVAQLKQKGVEFLTPPISAPDAAAIACALDPDGLLIELVQID
ncbi:MAG: glyoxalase [Gemmatimonadetes bacterium]|jgi:glyoxylase I family protein|nr:glyoxalase [Gemmatimonadota bacterium]